MRLLTPVAPKRYVLVIPGDGDDSFEQSAACRLLSQLHTAVANQFAMNCVFYVGVEVATLDDFHLSLESARNIMCVGSDQEQFLFVAERTAPVGYDYTDRQEETLRQLIEVQRADERGKGVRSAEEIDARARALNAALDAVLATNPCVTLK